MQCFYFILSFVVYCYSHLGLVMLSSKKKEAVSEKYRSALSPCPLVGGLRPFYQWLFDVLMLCFVLLATSAYIYYCLLEIFLKK